ncbi:MAG: VTT domain-containing protein [Chloroflexi bacterium]|nr:VTT domain-containing protein [Chloroflexota bacterium]
MSDFSTPPPVASTESPPERRSIWKVILTLGALGAMSGLFLFFPIDWEKVGAWGYVGVFAVTFVATASFILPIPYLLIVARAGMYLDPVMLTLVAGVAGALGELTGYAVGVSGRDLIARGKWYDKANHWMVTYGFWCVSFFAFIPNPFFDAIGFAAGVLRYPLWRFFLACLLGKALKFWFAAESHLVVDAGCTVFPIACQAIRSFAFPHLFGH